MAFWDGQLLQTLSFCPTPGFSKIAFWGEGGFANIAFLNPPPDFQKLQFWPIPTLSFEALPPPPPPGRTAWAGAGGPGPGRRPGRSSGPPPGTPWAGAGEGPRACAEAQEERGAKVRGSREATEAEGSKFPFPPNCNFCKSPLPKCNFSKSWVEQKF